MVFVIDNNLKMNIDGNFPLHFQLISPSSTFVALFLYSMHLGTFISVCIIDVDGRDGVRTRSSGSIELRWMAVFFMTFSDSSW